MKCIILVAGHATRLEEDIKQDERPEFEKLRGVPKALLPGPAGPTLLDNWWSSVGNASNVQFSEVFLVVNADKYKYYERYAARHARGTTLSLITTNITNHQAANNQFSNQHRVSTCTNRCTCTCTRQGAFCARCNKDTLWFSALVPAPSSYFLCSVALFFVVSFVLGWLVVGQLGDGQWVSQRKHYQRRHNGRDWWHWCCCRPDAGATRPEHRRGSFRCGR
eukprot:m.259803 g.259803  ORF g.259803 m.259803 type:complete len:221 (+) comp19206_c0_seq12:186-848(+)